MARMPSPNAPSWGRMLLATLRQLGHQVAGYLFLIFAATAGFSAIREWMRAPKARLWWIELTVALMFAYFGISSLMQADSSRP